MKTLIVYDSFFGNTEQMARAIGNVLGIKAEVNVLQVGDVKPEHLTGANMLIVGSPTRAFSPSPAIKEFLAHIPRQGLRGVTVAAFDTHVALSDVNSRVLPILSKSSAMLPNPSLIGSPRRGESCAFHRKDSLCRGLKGR